MRYRSLWCGYNFRPICFVFNFSLKFKLTYTTRSFLIYIPKNTFVIFALKASVSNVSPTSPLVTLIYDKIICIPIS